MSYSSPLQDFAPACLLHMTEVERSDYDAEPLWSAQGQVLWFLQEEYDNLVTITMMASELMLPESTVRKSLLKLEDKGEVFRNNVNGIDYWAVPEQYQENPAGSAEWIASSNAELHEVKHNLRALLAQHSIAVNSLSDVAPGLFHADRADQIMIQTSSPVEAAWLHSRLSSDQPALSAAQGNQLLDLIEDYRVSSDMRMYAWAIRRQQQNKRSGRRRIDHARDIEFFWSTETEGILSEIKGFVDDLVHGRNPDVKEDLYDEEDIELSDRSADVEKFFTENNPEVAALSLLASAGLAVSIWRKTIEPWDCLFTHAQLAWMSMITTRDLLSIFSQGEDNVDFDAVADVLCNGERCVLPEDPAADAFGPAWSAIAHTLVAYVKRDQKANMTVRKYAAHGLRFCPQWWGGPEWKPLAKKAAKKLALDRREASLLANKPYELPFTVWEQFIASIDK